MGLITYFTAGVKEVRAWTIKQGTNAQKSASEIHTDIEKGFIRAEVVSFDKFIELNMPEDMRKPAYMTEVVKFLLSQRAKYVNCAFIPVE